MLVVVVGEAGVETAVVAGVGIATIVVLALQYWLGRRQWLLALYGRRYPVFAGTMRFVAASVGRGGMTEERLGNFRRDVWDYRFLFGGDVGRHLVELEEKGKKLAEVEEARRRGRGTEEELRKLAGEAEELYRYFGEQKEATEGLFLRYLEVGGKGRIRRKRRR